MKTKLAVLTTACITFVITLIFLYCFDSKYSLVNYDYLDGVGEFFLVGDGTYELVKGDESEDWLYSTYQNQTIMSNAREYVFENEALYFYSDDGYAIVYPENNLCKIYLFPGQDRVSKILASPEYPKNKLIVYLDSFDEYTEHEKTVLNKLMYKYYYEQQENEK